MPIRVSSKLESLLIPNTRVVVFTGAGISAESGIPTFRGQGGLWKDFRIEEFATVEAFERNPAKVWEWYRWRRDIAANAQPNAGHLAVAEFERFFEEFVLVTQNIDGLHDRAGNRKILKLHGDIWEDRCQQCGRTSLREPNQVRGLQPRCECGGWFRPGVVWFGERLPQGVFEAAEVRSRQCELFLAVGTSAEVYPAAFLPAIARQHGAHIVEVNIEASAIASLCDESLLGSSSQVLPALLKRLKQA
ncbi:MAG: NAD-dependent deacylase [Acidobacteriota bacterium]